MTVQEYRANRDREELRRRYPELRRAYLNRKAWKYQGAGDIDPGAIG